MESLRFLPLVVALLVTSSFLPIGAGLPSLTLSYPVDPDALRAEFRATGSVELLVPGLGLIKVIGTEADIFVQKKWFIIGESRDDVIEEGVILDIPIKGAVEGDPESVARITLGMYGVYGRVQTGGKWYSFSPEQVAGVNVQHVAEKRGATPEPHHEETSSPDFAAMATVSKVLYDAELGFRNRHSDWSSRISSGFNEFDQMWANLGITLQVYGIYGVANTITNNECANAVADYRNWLNGGYTVTGVDAYQLWTDRDLESSGLPEKCYGRAYQSDGVRSGANSASVMEGYDANAWDVYDPDEVRERGVVSGHEFSHTYGEENHQDHCNNLLSCNMMKTGVDNDVRDFYWTSASSNEIDYRFNYATEY